MDEISPLLALPLVLGNLISDELVLDITGIELIANRGNLFSEPSMTKLPLVPLTLDNRISGSKSKDDEENLSLSTRQSENNCLIFSDAIDQELKEDDSTALHPLTGISDSQYENNSISHGIKRSDSWDTFKSVVVEDLAPVEEKCVVKEPKRTFSTSLLEVSEETKINRQSVLLKFPPLWGFTSICGRRAEMEDSVVALPRSLQIPPQMLSASPLFSSINQDITAHVFGVYDGHGGSQVANYCQERLHLALQEEIGIAKQNYLNIARGEHNLREKWLEIFVKCFHRMDNEVGGFPRGGDGDGIASNPPAAPESVGSTAVVAIVCSSHFIVANCGDSRAVLYRGKVPMPMSVDHKPNREDECARIEAAGGKVINWDGHRVSGVLAVSRSIGDRYLRPYVVADPEVMFLPRTKEDECLILASDGLWDVMTNDEACNLARKRILLWHKKNGPVLSKERGHDIDPAAQDAADYLSQLAFQRGSRDNISVVVVDLKAQRKFKKKP